MPYKNIFVFILLALLNGCASTKMASRPQALKLEHIDPELKDQTKGSGRIGLLEHQLLPIDFLKKHPEQKGLLVNHYMGTGKTYLGLGFAEAFPEHPVIILAPKFLESHWYHQLEEFGASHKKRFTFVSYEDAPSKLINRDLSNYLILADEAHNLIKKMHGVTQKSNNEYTELYLNLRKAYKIIALTGTPIYSNESDLAYMINFVSGQDLMPFNEERFRIDYTKIITSRQFFRGYVTESNLVNSMSSYVLSNFLLAIMGTPGVWIGLPIAVLLPVFINKLLPPVTYKLRELDAPKLIPFMNQYISYFKFDEKQFKDFPAQNFVVEDVPYNRFQYSFFLHLVEGDLPLADLKYLLKDEANDQSDEMIKINSSAIHEQLYSTPGAGRDIGNFEFRDQEGKIVEPPKFVKIYEDLTEHPEPTVIYSNYYQTGILAFEQFLKRQGYEQKYGIIEPSLSVSEVTRIVNAYNKGEIKLLLLHPDITEGISLKGTLRLHILEPMLNATVLEQVIGRARRFQSHSHLPKEKQLVQVRMWQSTSSAWDPEIGDINRANWFKRYRELSYLSRWGIGMVQVDKKYERKVLNPEELALLKLRTLEKNLSSLQKLMATESIERGYATNLKAVAN